MKYIKLLATLAIVGISVSTMAAETVPAKKSSDANKRRPAPASAIDGSLEESPNPFTGLRYNNEDMEQMRTKARIQAEIAGQNAQYEQSMLQAEENRKRRDQLKRYGLAAPAHLAAAKPLPSDLITQSAPGVATKAPVPRGPSASVPAPASTIPFPSVEPRPAFVVGVLSSTAESVLIREGAAAAAADAGQVDRALRQLRSASTVGRVQVDNRDAIVVPATAASATAAKQPPADAPPAAKAEPSSSAPGAMSTAPVSPSQ